MLRWLISWYTPFFSRSIQPPSMQKSSGDQSPIISHINGDVTVIYEADSTVAEGVGSGAGSQAPIDTLALRHIAEDLLRAATPPSLLPLFPTSPRTARQALEEFSQVRRTVSGADQPLTEKLSVIEVTDLTTTDDLHHLVIAPPGSGKTHALWHAAHAMLQRGGVIPLFIPFGQFARWDDAINGVADIVGTNDVIALFRDTRVCVLLDGWSEFAVGFGADERARALRVLNRTRVIANGRRGMIADTGFRLWVLDPPAVSTVQQVTKTAFPRSGLPAPPMIELLRLPLALSLFILLGGSASTRGELLSRLHRHLSGDLPERFRETVAGAVAAIILRSEGRPYTRFEREFQERASQRSLDEPLKMLEKLGTFEDRAGTVLPVHDLYWSWLGGLGLLAENRLAASLPQLTTRECYELALESGAVVAPGMVAMACTTDITLAAVFSRHLGAGHTPDDVFGTSATVLFADDRLPVRCRAAIAAFQSGRPELLREALNVLTEAHNAKLYIPAFAGALNPTVLFPNRGIIADWLGAPGTEQVTDAIAVRGDAAWGPWLRQMAESGRISMPIAIAATLACDSGLPEWITQRLVVAVSAQSWKFHAVAERGTNTTFANWLAEHYEECIGAPGTAAWFHLNRVLVACGTEATFERLLARFLMLPEHAQETIGFAVVDRGEPWIARFQAMAFTSGDAKQHHKLGEVVSLGIDDETARRWIANGPTELGWRVLAARHGPAIVSEMLTNLPASFADIHVLPPLAAMQSLPDAPASLTDDILKRLTGRMQPKVMQDVIYALARVRPTGMQSIISFIHAQARVVPIYFVRQTLALLREWEQEQQRKIRVRFGTGDMPFAEWILSLRLPQDRNDHLFRQTLAAERDLAVKLVLGPLRSDKGAVMEIMSQIEPLTAYDAELYDLLVANPELAALVLKVFSGAFDTFPEASLLRAVTASGIGFDALLRALATASSPSHLGLHKALIEKLLNEPLDLFKYREMAKILRAHPTAELLVLLKNVIRAMTANEIWLIREIEAARGELLINEQGVWLS